MNNLRNTRAAHSLRVIVALTLREVESGGKLVSNMVLWPVIEPVFGITLLSILFAIALPAPPLGNSFALFYASGLLPLMLFQDVTQKMIVAVRYSRPLLGFASIGPLEMILSRVIVAILIQLMVMTLILGVLVAISPYTLRFDVPALTASLFSVGILALGFGAFGCWLSLEFPVWPRIWAIALRPLIFVSGVFFLIDDIAAPYREWAMWNPLAQVISVFRQGIYQNYHGVPSSLGLVIAIGLIFLAAGLVGLQKREPQLIDGII